MAGGNKGATLQTKLKGDILSFPVAANTTMYRGAAATLDVSAGGASHDITAADHNRFVGMCEEGVDNSTGALAAKSVRARRKGIFRFQYGRADATSGVAPAQVDFSTNNCTVSDGATERAGTTKLTFGSAVEFALGDFITIAGVTDTLGKAHMNGTWRISDYTSTTVMNLEKAYEACTGALAIGTATFAKCLPAATDLLKTAFLAVAQQATVEEQAWALQGLETVDKDRVLLGPIVKLEPSPSPHVWIDIVTTRMYGCSLEFTTTVTDISVVEGLVTFVGGT